MATYHFRHKASKSYQKNDSLRSRFNDVRIYDEVTYIRLVNDLLQHDGGVLGSQHVELAGISRCKCAT